MKRYIVFAYTQYDTDTPINCILGAFDDLEEAKNKLILFNERSPTDNYGEILDCETMKEVFDYHKGRKID